MSKIYGIGETVYDIIFRDGQPQTAVPGGSAFNAIISLGRCGVHPVMTTAIGDDHIGRLTLRFMEENGVDTSAVSVNRGCRSHLSLAFLNERNDAEYQFYKDPAHDRVDAACPRFHAADIVLFGSFFAVNPVLRTFTRTFLSEAHAAASILYYDVNFRASHIADLPVVMESIVENMQWATIVRGSMEDFQYLFGLDTTIPDRCQLAEHIYQHYVSPYCPILIVTDGAEAVHVLLPAAHFVYPVPPLHTVSTVGAGDNFNAGIVYGLYHLGMTPSKLLALPEEQWKRLVALAQRFSADVCQRMSNNVSIGFAHELRGMQHG